MQALLTILILSFKTRSAFSTKHQHCSLTALTIRGGSSQLPSSNNDGNINTNMPKSQRKRRRKSSTRTSSLSSSAPTALTTTSSRNDEVETEKESPQEEVKAKKRVKSKKVSVIRDSQETTATNLTRAAEYQNAQRLNRINNENDISNKAASKKSTSTDRTPNSKARGGKDGECLRRIKREWKDAVQLGIAYDWKTRQTVTVKGRSPSGRFPSKDEDATGDSFYQYNYLRIGPYGKNLLRWHFSVKGPSHSVYTDGIYHGVILLPKDYPMSPPRVQMLTPSGRFNPGEDICLSASNYHPETWTPRWTILSLVDALRIHMLTSPNEIGGIDAPSEKRARLASESRSWRIGPIDHGKMVKSGVFNSKEEHDESTDSNEEKQTQDDVDKLMKLISSTGEEFTMQRERVESPKVPGVNMKKRTLAQTVIIVAFKALAAVLKSPLRLGIFIFAIYHFYLRPLPES